MSTDPSAGAGRADASEGRHCVEKKDWPRGYGLVVLDEVDSTMAEARRRAADLDQPTWIMARRQLSGHGRRGRAWASPEGNLAATLVLPKPGTALQSAQRSFVAALALYDALCVWVEPDTADHARIRLKWPNDVLVDGGKIAGILLEAHGGAPKLQCLAIGLGVNLAEAPSPGSLEPDAVAPIALSQLCVPPSPEAFFTRLAMAYAFEEMLFQDTGFAHIRRKWLQHAARLGETVTARTGSTEMVGIFAGVDKDGQLVLETRDGRRAIPAADVYF